MHLLVYSPRNLHIMHIRSCFFIYW